MTLPLRVLVCTVPGAEPRLRAVLPEGELHFVYSSGDALAKLRDESFDLLIVGIRFDESRALELLGRMALDPTLRKPAAIVGIRGAKMAMRVSPEVFDIPMRAVGAGDIIDFSDIPNDEPSNAAVRERLLRCCGR
jgi:hypothetical protein